MIDGVDECFFHGRVRKVGHAGGFGAVRVLAYGLVEIISPVVVQRFPDHPSKRSAKNLFLETVARCALHG